MLPGFGAADRRAALVGGREHRAECRGTRHTREGGGQIGGGAEQHIIVNAIGGRDARDRIALPDIVLDRAI